MFLTVYNLPHYLISKGIISAESVVGGDFAVAEAGRRNRNFKVLRRKHPGLFVKQIKSPEAQAIATLQREAAFYRTVGSSQAYASIRGMVPGFVDFDDRRRALTVNLIEDSESLAERHMREGAYREDLASLLGERLGQIHSQGAAMAVDPALRHLFTYQLPWPMMLDQIGYTLLDNLGPIGPALSKAIRQMPALQSLLSELRPIWQYDSLVHGDMKWDNCMIKEGPAGERQLKIVDWELADIGDGAWDVAAVFKEYVAVITVNAHQRETAAATGAPGSRAIQIEELQPSIRAFWNAYVESRRLPDSSSYLNRAVRFTGARMVIGVLEYLFNSKELGTLGAMMLQTSVNVLEAPHIAASQLLGSNG